MDERLRLTLLGHFAAFRRGAPLTGFESNKVRGLLAFLAVEQARGHSRASLIGLLWPDWPESSARRNLSQALFNLRQTLDDQNAQTPFLLVSRQEIRWNRAAPADIDGQQVLALLPEPGQIPDPAKMEQVSSLYRGRLLESFSLDDSDIFDHWLLTKREWLHGRVMAALHHYAQGLLSGGVAHFDTAHAIISQQLLLEPWREEAHSQMMRLLAARGQRSAALAQFELCRAALAAELGVEPSQETLALYQQLRDGSWRPPPALTEQPPLRPASPPRDVRPAPSPPPARPVGREKMAADIDQQLTQSECRLLTLVGPGGNGKTHLAMHAAWQLNERFADGCVFVPLADALSSGREEAETHLVQSIASALQLQFDTGAPAWQQVRAALAEQETLLVLDNFEPHMACAELLPSLLNAAQGLRLLVTSRERLNLAEEWLLPVTGLDAPPPAGEDVEEDVEDYAEYSAVQLFCACARRVDPGFVLDDENREDVARICRMVDGMPLALTLAAAWARHISPAEIGGEIERTSDFLASNLRNLPPRHRSIRAVFDYSWQLLSAEEQLALIRLAVFPQSFSRQAAQEVAGVPLPLLSGLVDRSLLRRAAAGRFEIHPLLRQFAGERLAKRAELQRAVQESHSRWYAYWLRSHLAGLSGQRQPEALAAVMLDTENVRAGWNFAAAQASPALLDTYGPGLFHFYNVRGWYQEGAHMLEAGMAGLRAAPDSEEARLTLAALGIHLAYFYHRVNRLAEARRLLEEALPPVRAVNRPGEVGFALNGLGLNYYMAGEYDLARPWFEEALTHYQQVDQPAGRASVLNNLGNLSAAVTPDPTYAEACAFYREAIAIARSNGNLSELARGLINLGTTEHVQHAWQSARRYYEEAIAVAENIGSRRLEAVGLTNLGEILIQLRDLEGARVSLQKALALRRAIGDQRGRVYSQIVLAGIEKETGDRASARRLWLEAARLGVEIQTLAPALNAGVELAVLLTEEESTQTSGFPKGLLLALAVLRHPAAESYTQKAAQEVADRLTSSLGEAERRAADALAESIGFARLLEEEVGV